MLGVGVVVLLVLVVIASHGVYWAKPDDSAGARDRAQEQVLAAAKKCFAQINTYDYRKLTGLVKQDITCTTGTFTSDLTKALTSRSSRSRRRLKAVQTAQVNRAGIVSVSRERQAGGHAHLRPAVADQLDDRRRTARASMSSAPSSPWTRSAASG